MGDKDASDAAAAAEDDDGGAELFFSTPNRTLLSEGMLEEEGKVSGMRRSGLCVSFRFHEVKSGWLSLTGMRIWAKKGGESKESKKKKKERQQEQLRGTKKEWVKSI